MYPKTKSEPLFFIDSMLGNIARKLRLLGYDTLYFSNIDDDKLIDIARKEKRIIISKDNELIKKTKKLGMETIYISKEEELEQFFEIMNLINLKIQINGDTARCPKCNSLTELIDRYIIKEKIPRGILESNNKFWICKFCNQIYWEGTHIKNLQKFMVKVNERLQ